MVKRRLRVLFISELFPNPAWPAFGIFVERQVCHLRPYCDIQVIAPLRVFPPLRIWRSLLKPSHFVAEWRHWWADLACIPARNTVNDVPVCYPRYASPPKQVFHGTWGFFAYPFVRSTLKELHSRYHFDLIHAHYAVPSGVIALFAQRWMKVPVVLSVHGSDVTYTVHQNSMGAWIIRWVLDSVDAIIANSTWTARRIVRHGGNPERVEIVHYGGNPEEAPIVRMGGDNLVGYEQPKAATKNGTLKLLSVGYFEERKGHAYVLRALKELILRGYELQYVVVGDGSQRKALEALTHELGLAKVVSFEGYKPHAEVWSYFADCNIFVLPSWNEAFGIVYIEALSLGKPVVGCEGEGGPEELKALGDCVELVKPRDVESLAAALQRLIDNPERRQRMGEVGRQIVQEHFTWQRNAADTLALYHRVLGQKNA
ncbi:MAG: glycosyltransferase [Dehalococcoidia bacterium]|nr:glycosyltransferase [Dehalococcoidia bacterium]